MAAKSTGPDALLQWLRVISIVAFLLLVADLVLVRGPDAVPLAGLLVGAILLELGYEVVVPGIVARVNGSAADKEKRDAG